MPPVADVILDILDQAPAQGLPATEILARLLGRGTRISQPTLSRRLRELKDRGAIIQHGARRGRGVLYARDPVALHFSVPAERRPPVNYNFDLILEYEPNVSHWVSEPQRAQLCEAGEKIRALPPTQGNTVLERLSIDLSWASSYLEGNTYSLLDTERLIVDGKEPAGHTAQETRMILNHKETLDYLRRHVGEFGPFPRDVYELHALLANGLLADEADAGRVRRGIIEISGTSYLPITPPQQLEEQLGLILDKARFIDNPFEQSVFLLAFIPYLQPFIDVNKRVGRLAANIPLLKANLCPMSYRDMNKERYISGLMTFYELNRPESLVRVYCEAYVRGTARYSALVEQGRQVHPFEVRYYRKVKDCVAAYVQSAAVGEHTGAPASFARTCFSDLPPDAQKWLADRVAEIVVSLHEGNSIAWGVSRELWERYVANTDDAPRAPSL